MYRRGAGFVAAAVRVLVAFEPHIYREVLAFHLCQQRPLSEVVLASPQTLRDEAKRMRPHLIVANEVPPMLREMGFFSYWVELHTGERLDADIRVGPSSTIIHDVSLQDLLAVVDKAEEELAHDEA
jgi:hypothetical protein